MTTIRFFDFADSLAYPSGTMARTSPGPSLPRTWAIVIALAVAGCASEPPVTDTAEAVGPAGATLKLDSGASLTIPAGAVSQSVDIGMKELLGSTPPTENFTALGPFFQLTPEGQTFAEPVSVIVPFQPDLAGSQLAHVRVFHTANGGESWNALPLVSHASPALVGGQTTHFSVVVAGLAMKPVDDPGEGTSGGGDPPPRIPGSPDGCAPAEGPGCNDCECESICGEHPECCLEKWSSKCVSYCKDMGECGDETGDTPLPPTQCLGHCDTQAPSGCHCDAICVESGDCCPDACSSCGHCPPVCGDSVCGPLESCSGCPQDCGPCSTCGDDNCTQEESCETCPTDCGVCVTFCGDGTCTGFETCDNCEMDCGECGAESTCVGHCDSVSPGGCWCDAMCIPNGDCCDDACAACEICP